MTTDTDKGIAIADIDIEENADTEVAETEAAAESEKPRKSNPSVQTRMLEMLLREKCPAVVESALAEGKTIEGAWNYVVSVMKNAYIKEYGRVNGGMCTDPNVVVGIAERYLREFAEGSLEEEVKHEPKPMSTPSAATAAVNTAKAAARSAKSEAKRKREEMMKKWSAQQLSLF